MKADRVPRYITAPYTILWYESDDLVPIFFGLGLGIITEHSFYGLMIGLVLAKLYQNGKEKQPLGYLRLLLYRFGLLDYSPALRALPKSWEKEFKG